MRGGEKVPVMREGEIVWVWDNIAHPVVASERYYLGTLPTHRAVRDLKLKRWREEAEGDDPVKRRCARFYLSQVEEGKVRPT